MLSEGDETQHIARRNLNILGIWPIWIKQTVDHQVLCLLVFVLTAALTRIHLTAVYASEAMGYK